MAQIPDKIINSIKELISESEKYNIHIIRAVVFGSWARGRNTEYSDIDVAIVSEDFDGVRFYDNMKLMKPVLKVNSDIETHPFKPEDFNEENPFVKEILSYGIDVI